MAYNFDMSPNIFSLSMVRLTGMSRQHTECTRRAVRAVVMKDSLCLMIYSTKEGDYKFPGGGILPGEGHKQALAREMLEETGFALSQTIELLGTALELDFSRFSHTCVFRMVSFYYRCNVGDGQSPLSLEPYEAELGYVTRWIPLREALLNNEKLEKQAGSQRILWLARETAILRVLIDSGWN